MSSSSQLFLETIFGHLTSSTRHRWSLSAVAETPFEPSTSVWMMVLRRPAPWARREATREAGHSGSPVE